MKCSTRRWLSAAIAVTWGVLPTALAQRAIVVASYNDPQYQRAMSGAVQALGKTPVDTFVLGNATENTIKQLAQNAAADTAFISLGARATELVLSANQNPTLVGCMLVSAEPLRALARAGAATLDLPPEQHVAGLKRLLPQAKDIGILYDPAENGKKVDALVAALRRAGLRPHVEPVRAPNEIPAALERLANSVDALLGLPDQTVFNTPTAKAILLFSFRQRIPLVGLSEAWVKAGALYALEWDYEEMGRYCGQLALRLLSGRTGASPATPSKLSLTINLRTANYMKIAWGDEVVQTAGRAYE